MTYDELLIKYDNLVHIREKHLDYGFKGIYRNGVIFIEESLCCIEKKCILAEELGHHFTSSGEIIDQRSIINIKQEKKAHLWAVNELVSCSDFLRAISLYDCDYKIAECLEISKWFLEDVYSIYDLCNNYESRDMMLELSYQLCI